MEFDELRAFLGLAAHGSFLAAATQLGVSRTTLRRRVDALESRLGLPLVVRNVEGVTLTEAGEVLLVHARDIVGRAQAVVNELRELEGDTRGRLRVVSSVSFPAGPTSLLTDLLDEAMTRVEVQTTLSADPLATSLEGVDLVIHFSYATAPAGWETVELKKADERVLTTRQYAERHGVPETVADLRNHAVGVWMHPRVSPLVEVPSPSEDDPRQRLRSNSLDLLIRWLCRGRAMMIGPDPGFVEPDFPDVEILTVLDDVRRECSVCASMPRASRRSKKLRLILEGIAQLIAGMAPRTPSSSG